MAKTASPRDMRSVFAVLNDMMGDGVIEKYAIGGAVAYSIHLEPITTLDIDIFVAIKPLPGRRIVTIEPIYDYLVGRGAIKEGEHITFGNWPLQFLPADTSPLVAEAVEQAQEFEGGGVTVRVFGIEHLTAIALETGREKDKIRLNALVKSNKLDKRAFRDILRRHRLGTKYEEWMKWQKTH